MANSSFEGEFDEFLNQVPVELRTQFVRWILEQRASLRRLDQKYFARITETEGSADCLALILEYALARFDFLAYILLVFGSRYPNTNAIEASPLLQRQIEDLVKVTLKNVKPSLDKFGEDRAADVTSELNLKLRAKQQGCLATVELLQANGGALPDPDNFSRQIATSPMRSRAYWWARPLSMDLDDLLKAGDDALQRGRAAASRVAETLQRESSETIVDDLLPPLEPTGGEATRKHSVELFLTKCASEIPFRVTRAHIWKAVGHAHARQFQYWQACSSKATTADDENFSRIVSMAPREFEALLKNKGIIEEKN